MADMIVGYSMILLVIAVSLASASLAEEETSASVEQRFRQQTKGASWQLVETREVDFQTFHPQGMTAVGDRFFLSSVEVIDRRADEGTGRLFEMDRQGTLLRQITLGEGKMYHPGGIDFDGMNIWISVGEYRSDSASIVYTVDPETMEQREVFRFDDHLGAISHFPASNLLVAVSWGSRRFYRWKTEESDGRWTVPDPTHPVMQPNGSHYIDYQDMQRLPGTAYLLCSGLQGYNHPESRFPAVRLGGIDLVHVEELRAHHQIPVPLRPPAAPAWTQNPFYVELAGQGLRFYFVPEDDKSLIYVFEVETEVEAH